jgi:hypothetical protein
MKYTKPQITSSERASSAIMSTQTKELNQQVDASLVQGTNPGYSADE